MGEQMIRCCRTQLVKVKSFSISSHSPITPPYPGHIGNKENPVGVWLVLKLAFL